jgi:dipeptide/tripeptide permease
METSNFCIFVISGKRGGLLKEKLTNTLRSAVNYDQVYKVSPLGALHSAVCAVVSRNSIAIEISLCKQLGVLSIMLKELLVRSRESLASSLPLLLWIYAYLKRHAHK